MKKGKLIVQKSKKGKIFANLEKENGKSQPLTFLHLKNTDLDGADCEYKAIGGQILKIVAGGNVVYEKSKPKPQNQKRSGGFSNQSNTKKVHNEYSISEESTKLPSDTEEALLGKGNVIDNFNLKLNKSIIFKKDNKKNCDVPRLHESEYKGKKFEVEFDFAKNQEIIQSISQRQKAVTEQFITKFVDLKTNWRTAVGLGNPSVFETNITLHHIYGIPYIPGSAVKGVIRHWAVEQEKDKKEKRLFEKIFGTQKESGNILFFDAFPTEPPLVEPDVMNVHYPNYYGGNEAPTDFQNPNPIFFLTVKETKFHFTVGIKKKVEDQILETAFNWLKEALEQHGIGAKTAVGYGRMK